MWSIKIKKQKKGYVQAETIEDEACTVDIKYKTFPLFFFSDLIRGRNRTRSPMYQYGKGFIAREMETNTKL